MPTCTLHAVLSLLAILHNFAARQGALFRSWHNRDLRSRAVVYAEERRERVGGEYESRSTLCVVYSHRGVKRFDQFQRSIAAREGYMNGVFGVSGDESSDHFFYFFILRHVVWWETPSDVG